MIILSGAGTVTAGFSPADLGGYDWDLDPDAIAGSDGDPVVQLPDISPAARHYGQATGARQPTLKVGLYNGHNAVRFAANQDLQQDPTVRNMAAANTLVCVCTPSTLAEYILRGNGGEGGPAIISGFASKAFEYFFRAAGERATLATTTSGPHVLTVTKTDDSGVYKGFFDGVEVFSNAVNAADDWAPRNILRIGAFTAGASQCDSDLLRVIHYSQNHAGTSDLDDLHGFLLDRFNI